jgi:hypothetical protein
MPITPKDQHKNGSDSAGSHRSLETTIDGLSLFGLIAVSLMLVFYAQRRPPSVLAAQAHEHTLIMAIQLTS